MQLFDYKCKLQRLREAKKKNFLILQQNCANVCLFTAHCAAPPHRATPAIKHSVLFWQQVDKTFHSQPKMRNHNANKREGEGEKKRERERAAAF